jgi:hypothetical protein
MGMRLGTAIAAFVVALVSAGLGAGQASAGTWDDLAWMYKPSEIVQIHLTLDDEQKTAINTNDELRDWVGGIGFWMTGSGGRSFASSDTPWRIEAKLKGHTSFRFLEQKAAFNLKFPKDSRPDGLKRMTLNNMVQDPSYLRETEAYEIFRAADLPAARTGYAQLWINDEYYGLYLNLEKYNDQSLEHWFPSLGHLFEDVTRNDILRSGDLLKEDFEVDEGDEEDWSDLEALAAAVRTGDWTQIADHLAEPNRVIRYLAAEWYVGQWDGYAWNRGNYYLHSDTNGLFMLLPSGLDQSLRPTVPRGDFDLSIPLATAIETWNPPRGPAALTTACFADPGCSDRFIHELVDVKEAANGLDVPTEVSERAAALSPLIATDPRKEHDLTSTALAQGRIVSFLNVRNSAVERLLETHPLTMHTPSITAGPQAATTATDATFEFGVDDPEGVTGFECRLDEAGFSPCSSPVSYGGLSVEDHRFEVRAVNDGDTPSPVAARTWTINEVPKHTLTIDMTGDGSGTVSADPEGPEYEEGTEVTLTATPAAGSTFTGWTGCDSVVTTGDCIVTMGAADRSVEAGFASIKQPSKRTLTINEVGDGSGTVSADPEGPEYDDGTEVTLTATPAAGSTFTGWTGCDSVNTAGDCIVTMDDARAVTAGFALVEQPGTVGWVKAPEQRRIKRGKKTVVAVRIKNAGGERLATELGAKSSNKRVKVRKSFAVKARPGEVDVVRAKVRATRKARGNAKITFTADGESAVTRLVLRR